MSYGDGQKFAMTNLMKLSMAIISHFLRLKNAGNALEMLDPQCVNDILMGELT